MKGKSPWLRSSSALPTRSALLIAMDITPCLSSSVASSASNLREQARLLRRCPSQPLHLSADVGPFDNETVVGQRLVRPLLALAHRVEPVGEVTGNLAVSP